MASPRSAAEPDSTPICRCRVVYLGSAVPHVTKDGLQGIQEPLRELYPEKGASGAKGIDSWLNVWSNGLLLENVDENMKKVTRFFPIETLHYCAAVRYVAVVPGGGGNGGNTARFLPLDSPFARGPSARHPPLFAAILRRTTGIKVLECHTFICKREMAANALVRCCFHAYADTSYARNADNVGGTSVYGTLRTAASNTIRREGSTKKGKKDGSVMEEPVTSIEKVEGWRTATNSTPNGHGPPPSQNGTLRSSAADEISVYNGDENHKVWAGGEPDYADYSASTLRSVRSSANGGTPATGTNRRPRQVSKATPPPPPPPAPSDADEKKKMAKEKNAKRKEMMVMVNHNGGAPTLMRPGRPGSAMSGVMTNGGMMRAPSVPALHMGNGYHPHPPPHPAHLPPPPMVLLHPTMHHGGKRVMHPAGSFTTQRPKSAIPPPMMIPRGMPPPQPMILAPGPMATMPHSKKHGKGMPHPVMQYPAAHMAMVPPHGMMPPMMPPHFLHSEEPVYMPSARPLSPVASFQPAHFPHEAYLMQQYATTERPGMRKRMGTKDRRTRRDHEEEDQRDEEEVAVELSAEGEELPMESPFNTGIYRKKGHLNERAFSYSIRQEHRARSYGSLANLKFATNGGVPPSGAPREDVKKEREIMQMMQDLDLSGDDLERLEVPQEIYESRKRRAEAAAGRR